MATPHSSSTDFPHALKSANTTYSSSCQTASKARAIEKVYKLAFGSHYPPPLLTIHPNNLPLKQYHLTQNTLVLSTISLYLQPARLRNHLIIDFHPISLISLHLPSPFTSIHYINCPHYLISANFPIRTQYCIIHSLTHSTSTRTTPSRHTMDRYLPNRKTLDMMVLELEIVAGALRSFKTLEITQMEDLKEERNNLLMVRTQIMSTELNFKRESKKMNRFWFLKLIFGDEIHEIYLRLHSARAEAERVEGYFESKFREIRGKIRTPSEILMMEDD